MGYRVKKWKLAINKEDPIVDWISLVHRDETFVKTFDSKIGKITSVVSLQMSNPCIQVISRFRHL
ncbi:ATP-dependent RNA helicase DHX37 [Pyrus ussuriensis x Pyrus communis]|uniref:ATP-dependent RNA helicase DHX37 n=1 Tax=Pyrus ussuriensis x Pyrus communis TaxID=2448454 RepID=A0A5N5I5P2_9ROSA|nr:ATP-dependent RNA helicase DHX37 [Pyrus ussuriensis x Pyrus communis]